MKTGRTVLIVMITSALVYCANIMAQDTLVVQIPASKDNTLFEDSTGAFSNGAGSYFFTGRTAPQDDKLRRGLISFNLEDSIPAGSEIISVSMQLHMSKTIAGTENISLHRLLANWGESSSDASGQEGRGDSADFQDATWLHTFFDITFWTTPGGDYELSPSATTPVGGIAHYVFGPNAVTASDAQLWLDNPDTNFGWILIGNEASQTTAKRFDTKENGNSSNRPVLLVSYVPPPCCIGIRGDCNNDGTDANILDLNFVVNRVFRGGPLPACPTEGDVNNDGTSANILDLNFLVNRVFRGGPAPGPC